MNCNFDASSCSSECPKFSMCAYNSVQNQLSKINYQINFLLNILTNISSEVATAKGKVELTEKNIEDIVSTLIKLTNDSETIHLTEGVRTSEKINK